MSAIDKRLKALETSKRAAQKRVHVVYVHDSMSEAEQEAAADRSLAEAGLTRGADDLMVLLVQFVTPGNPDERAGFVASHAMVG